MPAVEVAAQMSIHGLQRAQREGCRMDRVTSRALYGEYAWASDRIIGRLGSRHCAFVAERSAAFGRPFSGSRVTVVFAHTSERRWRQPASQHGPVTG
jgi:hypothetical protein